MTLYGTTYKYDHTCEKEAIFFIPTLFKFCDSICFEFRKTDGLSLCFKKLKQIEATSILWLLQLEQITKSFWRHSGVVLESLPLILPARRLELMSVPLSPILILPQISRL